MRFRRELLITFLALSLLSLLADMVYEGGRSIGGAYLNLLAAPAIAAGILLLGEFLSNLMRLIGGFTAHKARSSKMYWLLILIGYSTNLAIPILALAWSWEIALILFFIERAGKGLRAPARDVILSEVTEEIGRGKGFGLHELMDQVGAIAGPALISGVLLLEGGLSGYRLAFKILIIPTLVSIIMFFVAFKSYPEPRAVSMIEERRSKGRLERRFWIYLIGSALMLFGFIYWGIISYHLQELIKLGALLPMEVSILYMLAMAVDAGVAYPIGALYDRVGIRSVILAPILAIPITPSLFLLAGRLGLYLSAILWGLSMGVVETSMRVAIADLASIEARSLAYGIYSFSIGMAWLIGGLLMAYLYQLRVISMVIAISVGAELTALAIYSSIPKPP